MHVVVVPRLRFGERLLQRPVSDGVQDRRFLPECAFCTEDAHSCLWPTDDHREGVGEIRSNGPGFDGKVVGSRAEFELDRRRDVRTEQAADSRRVVESEGLPVGVIAVECDSPVACAQVMCDGRFQHRMEFVANCALALLLQRLDSPLALLASRSAFRFVLPAKPKMRPLNGED